jgi:hypothetical protein
VLLALALVGGLYTAFAANTSLTNDLLLDELRQMPPIASTAREKIAVLRSWAAGRAVPAN